MAIFLYKYMLYYIYSFTTSMIGQNNNLVPVSAAQLLSKCKCHEDLVNICRELGKPYLFNIYAIGFFFPNESGFDGKFFL